MWSVRHRNSLTYPVRPLEWVELVRHSHVGYDVLLVVSIVTATLAVPMRVRSMETYVMIFGDVSK